MRASFAQERLWFLDQLGLVGSAYNISTVLRLDGDLDVAALERGLSELVRRHESLRTRFVAVGGVPFQTIDPPADFRLAVDDLVVQDGMTREAALDLACEEAVQRPFDLAADPLLRGRLLRIGDGAHMLLLTMHHIVSDGWSKGILLRELSALYGAFCERLPSPLPDLPIQYADYAQWQRERLCGEVLDRQLSYWRGQLA
ncbi:condensation protein, partial [Xanthomonas arboricola]